jgi:hypothetical protein
MRRTKLLIAATIVTAISYDDERAPGKDCNATLAGALLAKRTGCP